MAEKQEALDALIQEAGAARKKLLETEVPAVTELMKQVRALRDQVGIS